MTNENGLWELYRSVMSAQMDLSGWADRQLAVAVCIKMFGQPECMNLFFKFPSNSYDPRHVFPETNQNEWIPVTRALLEPHNEQDVRTHPEKYFALSRPAGWISASRNRGLADIYRIMILEKSADTGVASITLVYDKTSLKPAMDRVLAKLKDAIPEFKNLRLISND